MKKLSTLLIALTLCGAAGAQTIPNAGFENWTAKSGYDDPNEWSTLDSIGVTYSLITCTEGTPGYGGSAHLLELTSKSLTFGSTTFAVPGIAVSGKIDVTATGSFAIQSGFPVSSRPQSLTGEWQYVPGAGDQGNIMVLLTKWNSSLSKRDTISLTNQLLTGSVTSMTTFSFDLTYQLGDVPDTGIILLASGKTSGGTDGSYLYVDDLLFTGSVPSGVVNVNNAASKVSVFPNPASIYTNVSYESKTAGSVKINIIDISGKTVKQLNFKKISGTNDFPIDVTNFAVGVYTVKITDDMGTTTKKLAVE